MTQQLVAELTGENCHILSGMVLGQYFTLKNAIILFGIYLFFKYLDKFINYIIVRIKEANKNGE
jgi:hypothetical protein